MWIEFDMESLQSSVSDDSFAKEFVKMEKRIKRRKSIITINIL